MYYNEYSDHEPAIASPPPLCRVLRRFRRGEAAVSWAGAGSGGASVISAESGVLGAELGAGLNIPVGVGSGELYMEASAELRSRSVEIWGNIGYRCRF